MKRTNYPGYTIRKSEGKDIQHGHVSTTVSGSMRQSTSVKRLSRNERECVVTADPDSSLLDQHGRARKTNVEAIVMNDQTNTQ